jgi:hypothetical protein
MTRYLFCIETGFTGESYERAYVWTEGTDLPEAIDQAREMFQERHPNRVVVNIEQLLTSDDEPFVTELSDCGFDRGAIL